MFTDPSIPASSLLFHGVRQWRGRGRLVNEEIFVRAEKAEEPQLEVPLRGSRSLTEPPGPRRRKREDNQAQVQRKQPP